MSAPSRQAYAPARGHLLVDHELRELCGSGIRTRAASPPVHAAQISPASLDLRLGARGWRMRAGFLPGARSIDARIRELSQAPLDLEQGTVLERGLAYLVELEEELELAPDLRGRFNPRSSTGRCDIFTRVLCEGHARFDETPAGYRGRLWIEIAPLSFPVRVRRGDRLTQMRLSRGAPALTASELRGLYHETPLCFVDHYPLALDEVQIDDEGGLALSVGLAGRDPAGWRATTHTDVVEFSAEARHEPLDFFEPLHATGGRCIIEPESFYIFASKERLRVPPAFAAEMLPIDVGIGELRNNYAGFFDNGFGWSDGTSGAELLGTPAVLEVRAHDVPFLVEDGQVFCRLRFFRTRVPPERLYGEGKAASYQRQDLTLARCFKRV